jgi:hypothetical protein
MGKAPSLQAKAEAIPILSPRPRLTGFALALPSCELTLIKSRMGSSVKPPQQQMQCKVAPFRSSRLAGTAMTSGDICNATSTHQHPFIRRIP